MKKTSLLTAAILGISSFLGASPQPEIIIYGTVQNSHSQTPKTCVLKITNVCNNETVQLNANEIDGAYEFRGGFCQTYVIEASAAGCVTSSKIVELDTEKTAELNFKLQEINKAADSKNSEKVKAQN